MEAGPGHSSMDLKPTLARIVELAFLLVIICGGNADGAQIALGQKRGSKSTGLEALSAITKPQLLNPDTNPTLRYPILNMSGSSIFSLSYGWFDVDKKGIHYTVIQPDKKKDESYEASLGDLTQVKMWRNFLEFHHGKSRERIFYLREDRWGSVHTGPGLENAANVNSVGTLSIARTMTNFDGVMAVIKPPVTGPEISLRADPGTIEKGQAATLIWTSQNATTLDLEPGSGHVAVAGSTSVSPADSTTYTLTATGPGGTRTATAYVAVTKPPPATPPTIILVEPSGAGAGQIIDIKSSPLIIRGVVTDTSGIPAVNINGVPAALRPKSALAAEFSSDPITLQPGENKFEVNATNAAHASANVTFTARFTPPPPPPKPAENPQPPVETNSRALDKVGIVELLKGEVASERVADLVKNRGIKFVPTPDDLKDIRAAGGGDDVIDAVLQAAAGAKK